MLPRVSVLMPNYNYARYIRGAIDSVLAQTMDDFELIIVDDGSADNSREIIESYLVDPRVRFRPVNHVGQANARNAAIEWARAPLFAFIDADDQWLPEKLAKQVALFDRDPSLGVVYTRRLLIDETGREIPYIQPPFHRGDVVAEMFRDNFVCFSTALVRRLVMEHIGLLDASWDLAVDYEFWLRVVPHYRFDFVDEPLVKYRCGHGNLSRRVGERLKTAMLQMRRFLNRDRHRLSDSEINQALSATYAHMGLCYRPYDSKTSFSWFARSLRSDLRQRLAWRGLAGLAMPYPLRRLSRRLLGRGSDWEAAYRVPENDPSNV
jgi:glycosyltransferase involved in cell wall biosynthesis